MLLFFLAFCLWLEVCFLCVSARYSGVACIRLVGYIILYIKGDMTVYDIIHMTIFRELEAGTSF